jgi:hypothetical protein
MSAIYDGQTFAGSVSKDGSSFAAFDADGNELGVFATQGEAVRAVLSPPPPAPPANAFDSDAALLLAIEELAKGGDA